MQVRSPGREDPLEEGMATHSSILAWRIPRTEEAGGLQFTGSQSRTRPSTHTPSHFLILALSLLIASLTNKVSILSPI